MPIEQLFYYAVTPEAEPADITPVLIDVSAPEILAAWTAAMEAHASQISARNYVELQTHAGAFARAARGRRSCHRFVSERSARSRFAGSRGPRRAAVLIQPRMNTDFQKKDYWIFGAVDCWNNHARNFIHSSHQSINPFLSVSIRVHPWLTNA